MVSFSLCIKFIIGAHVTPCLRQALLFASTVYVRLAGPQAAEDFSVSITVSLRDCWDCRYAATSWFTLVLMTWTRSPCLQVKGFDYKIISPALCLKMKITLVFFYKCFVFMYVCAPCVYLISGKTGRKASNNLVLELSVDSCEPPCGCRETNPGPLQKK